MRWAYGCAVMIALFDARPADACTPFGNAGHELAPTGADTTPPSAPTVEVTGLYRTKGQDNGVDCPSTGHVRLTVAATDNITSLVELGYRVTIVSGTDPGLSIFRDVRAIDREGNVSEPTIVTLTWVQPVEDAEEEEGCSTGRSPSLLVLALIPLLLRRRRR